jgi:hypothetical protein
MQAECHWKEFEFSRCFAIQPYGCAETRVKNLTACERDAHFIDGCFVSQRAQSLGK